MKLNNKAEFEAIKNNGEYHYQKVSSHIDDEDMANIRDTFERIKEKAIKRGYPYRVNKLTGRIKPYSTTEVNTVEMGYLIDETKQECCENGINPDLF